VAINLQSTSTAGTTSLKLLVYGSAGSGKTSLIPTLPEPVILSAEGGLLSIVDSNLPFIEIDNLETLKDAYKWLTSSDEAKQFQSVALDSISEIAEVVLATEKKKSKDGRAAYGEMDTVMAEIIRAFRDLPGRHVYFSAKLEKQADELGRILYYPSLPGNKTAQRLPYFFDEVLALRVEKDAEGVNQRALMCDTDGLWIAKDRSGKLPMWMAPDLGAVINLILGEKTNGKKTEQN